MICKISITSTKKEINNVDNCNIFTKEKEFVRNNLYCCHWDFPNFQDLWQHPQLSSYVLESIHMLPTVLFFLQKLPQKCVQWVNLQPVNWFIPMQRNLQNIIKHFWPEYFQMAAGLIRATTIHKISGTVVVSLVSTVLNWK